jgi:hypothetical protein
MPIGVQQEFSGTTLAQYDQVIQKMGFRSGGPGAPGALFHWVTKTDAGIRVVDVWESREIFEKFAAAKIGPLTAQAGITQPPKITFFEIHNYLTKG